jgi:hypothetical protein
MITGERNPVVYDLLFRNRLKGFQEITAISLHPWEKLKVVSHVWE